MTWLKEHPTTEHLNTGADPDTAKSGHVPTELVRAAPECEAVRAIQEFSGGARVRPPVPLEEMLLEKHSGIRLGITDLKSEFGPDALGVYLLDTREVLIDESLEPSEHPAMLGRYRFTAAHELGHSRMHSSQIGDTSGGSRVILCSRPSSDPREWEANRFASALLMPREEVFIAWGCSPYGPFRRSERELDRLCRRKGIPWDLALARKFEVSRTAMRIRLRQLGHIFLTESEE